MAFESSGSQRIGFDKGSVWGTAVSLSGAVGIHGRINCPAVRNVFNTTDVGFGLRRKFTTKLDENVDVTLTCDFFYGSHATMLIAMVLGSDVETETTTDEDDWAHVMDNKEKNEGLFTTLVWSYGSASGEVVEIPSVKWHTLKLTLPVNGVAQLEVQGIGDRVILSGHTNTRSTLNGLTYAGYSDSDNRYMAVGRNGHYFRINDFSGDALDSGDELYVESMEYQISRPLQRAKPMRGELSRYTIEPGQLDPSTETLTIQLSEVDKSVFDVLGKWDLDTQMKAEIYLAGSTIGAGVARSLKLQLPKLGWPGEMPDVSLPNNNTPIQPTIVLEALSATSAPTGMTGVTDTRIIAIDERDTGYLD